jgi:uncharacterized protein YlxW (UPF0749 family)
VSSGGKLIFNPAPGWPKPPKGWLPPKGWAPDPSWPPPPPGWQLWISEASLGQGGQPVGLAEPTSSKRDDTAGHTSPESADPRIAILEAENAALRAQLEDAGADASQAIALDDERVLQDVGIYRYHHPLENAVAFKERLDAVLGRIAEVIKADTAIERSNMFTFDGSLAKGRKMSADLAKLMLRAYNAEADNVVRSLRAGSVQIAIKRLEASRDAIAKLGKMMEMRISDAYHALRIDEVELASDYQMKKQEEREAAREERERLREEQRVDAELAAERERLDKERNHLVTVIEKLRAGGSEDADLERKLEAVNTAVAQNDYRAANIRAGYVYVISNKGAFGNHVVKIGLTRRLEPMDRINELGDASVPFRFDLHALYFSEDAVSLENDLHQHFAQRRVNWVNDRREFFFATPAEVKAVLASKVGNLLEFVDEVMSTEYFQSVLNWPETVRRGPHPTLA